MKKILLATAPLFLLLVTGPLHAQSTAPFELELKAGPGFTTQEVESESLGNGLGAEATAAYWFTRRLAVYGGWGWHRFAPEQSFAGADTDIEETGYVYGLRFEYPFIIGRASSPRLRLHVGGTYEHLEIEDGDGNRIGDSDHGVGWEAGAGVAFPVNDSWTVTPGVRYRALSREVTVADGVTDVDLEYVATEIAVSWRLGS